MNTIKEKAYGKINLGLDVLRRREDGYNEVKMIMQTVDIYDELELTKRDDNKINLTIDIEKLEADESNLVYKAIKLINVLDSRDCFLICSRVIIWDFRFFDSAFILHERQCGGD